MSAFMNVLHPSFDALSSFADQTDVEAARTRTGRHVAHCVRCLSVVDEIRALADEARGEELPGIPPAELWARIEAEAASDEGRRLALAEASFELPSLELRQAEAAPAVRLARSSGASARRRVLALAGGAAIAASVLAAIALMSGPTASLHAGAPSRFVVTPFRPTPGSRVSLRYTPAVRFADAEALLLGGRFLRGSVVQVPDFYFAGNFDSLAMLRRAGDGTFVGEIVLPADFQAVALVALDPATRAQAGDELASWVLVGGDARGRPALASLLAARAVEAFDGSRSAVEVRDTLQRYFPDHPAGFASATQFRGQGILSDLVNFFRSAERTYASFDARLAKQPRLDAERIAAMIEFARHIEEPGEAAKWTRRLLREHPDDPRSLVAYGLMIHDEELKHVAEDSLRRFLPLLDSLYTRTDGALVRFSGAYQFVERHADAAMRRRWLLRDLRDERSIHYAIQDEWTRDPEVRAAASAALRRTAARSCGPSTGLAPRRLAPPGWRERQCATYQSSALANLSHLALLGGDVRQARQLADSSVAIASAHVLCRGSASGSALGEALLAGGDTADAARAFAQSLAWDIPARADARRDSVARRFGARVSNEQWKVLSAQAAAELSACRGRQVHRDSVAARSGNTP